MRGVAAAVLRGPKVAFAAHGARSRRDTITGMRVVTAFLLWSAALLAQVVPGRYVVELSAPPLGMLARARNRSASATARRAHLDAEQHSARLWIEQRHGRIISSLTGVMNALVVDFPENDVAGLHDPSLPIPPGYPLVSRPENRAITNNKIIVARDYAQFYTLNNQADTAADRYGHGTATTMCAAGVPTESPLGRITGVAPKAWI